VQDVTGLGRFIRLDSGFYRINRFEGWLWFYLIMRAIWRGQGELPGEGIEGLNIFLRHRGEPGITIDRMCV
jgi:hypothetical protein